MKTMQCDAVRDVLPEVTAGAVDLAIRAAVDLHLAGCDECAAEQALVSDVRSAAPVPPAGLHVRITRTLAAPPPAAIRAATVRPYAIAAAGAFALLTGGLLMRSREAPPDVPATEIAATVPVGWPAVQSASVLRVTPSLHDLSEEELESLLAELDS